MAEMFRENLFDGKVAVVTGGGTGIGRDIAFQLLRLGCNVVIASRKKDVLETTASELAERKESRGSISFFPCNIRKVDEVKELFKFVVDKYKGIDFLVNNGGGQFPAPAENISAKGWGAVVDTNLNGTFHCILCAYHAWMGEHGGVIVNIIADYFNGFPGMAHTGAARAGVANLTKSLAVEWAEKNIRINSIAPGIIWSASAEKHYRTNTGIPDLFQQAIPKIPMKKLGCPNDISSLVLFLLSPGAQYITGDILKVDGGSSLNGPASWPFPSL